ncbi:ProQ/FinO family protein [Ignatzschineria rhizosphaerae]|uniref:ProQ/FinO family protein n=1 Tax=Ignatzschineria rhizosphaerae TaxID=2923279 RepID=A0ABY3WZD8_9GAMM|nr:ProQ/FinO family protein [Ignatzschineria rhizosphaerae]UNM95981.1 ProQ/FinO family protein [Ignatzschineria rhizosphaerae]
MSNENNTQLEASSVQEDTNLTPQEARQKRIEISQQLLQKLSEEFPTIFPQPKDGRPVALAIGIHKQLIPVVTEWGFSAVNLRSALSWYTKQLRYQQAVVHAPHRTNLDGTDAEIIDDEHRNLAKENVEKIQAILAKKNPERAKRKADNRAENRAPKNRKPKAARPNNAPAAKPAKQAPKEPLSLDEKMQSLLNKFNQ